MLHAIRIMWTVIILLVTLGVAHFVMAGTAMGAQWALHKAMTGSLGETWLEWIDYSALLPVDKGYETSLFGVQNKVGQEPPSWPGWATSWWRNGADKPLAVTVVHGRVTVAGNANPIGSLGIAPGVPARTFSLIVGTLVVLLYGISAALGRSVDRQSKAQQLKRPGSLANQAKIPPRR